MFFKRLGRQVLNYINKLLPKFNRVIVEGYPNTESSAISVANYLAKNYNMPVFYAVSHHLNDNPSGLLLPDVRIIDMYSDDRRSLKFLLIYMTCKYVFFTHGSLLDFFSDRQIVTNIWHGVLYKRVGVLNGNSPTLAHITVATSESNRKMFSEAFGVLEESIYVSGYPRNDMLLEARKGKEELKKSVSDLSTYKKVVIWLPTYRKNAIGGEHGHEDGVEVGNPFYIKDFKVSYFNKLLKENETLCLVKPHPYAPLYENSKILSNVSFIDSEWISHQGITLYQLLGCTDVLISDVSSVIIDYMLMDKPIICVSTDFEEYRKTRGFYFDNIEDYIPSRINTTQEEFFTHLENVLKEDADPSKEKREKLKKYFFDKHDARSTDRLVNHVMSNVI